MTTKANILLIAPELSSRSDDQFNLVIADVNLQVSSNQYGTRTEEAKRYLAAHLLTLIQPEGSSSAPGGSGPVEREKMGDAEIEYGSIADLIGSDATRYDLTRYGQRYVAITKRLVPLFKVY